MTQQEIQKAFEGRWRYKRQSMAIPQDCEEEVKAICLDFFTAAIILAAESHQAITTPQCPPALSSVHTADSRDTTRTPFDTWWALYDKKCGKDKCLQKWAKLTRTEQEACIRATPAYVASTPDKQYRKHPLTYLNQKAWNDEIITSNATPKPTLEQQRMEKLASILAD